jgi:hypothetical protein
VLEGPGGDLVAIEVKASETVSKEDFKGLKSFALETKGHFLPGIVLYSGSSVITLGDNLIACPISLLWN